MNSIDLSPLYRSSIGFDRMASLLNSAMASHSTTAGYPPYNIEVQDENRYAVTLAVAGFSREELDIRIEKGVLTVKGTKAANDEGKYLYQGIANRAFERKFNLADYVEVTDASLTDGLLTISLVKEVPEAMKPKTIEIKQENNALEHQATETQRNTKAA
jgi:molecular chaperone IbpA